jgi:hypothetical protein
MRTWGIYFGILREIALLHKREVGGPILTLSAQGIGRFLEREYDKH